MRAPNPKRAMAGLTLVEVLVALLVLSIGLLGLAGLQMTVLRSNHSAYQRSQATLLAQDITERLQANRAAALDGAYDDCTHPDCATWAARVPALLGEGAVGALERDGTAIQVTITWDESRGRIRDGSGAAVGDDESTFVYRTGI